MNSLFGTFCGSLCELGMNLLFSFLVEAVITALLYVHRSLWV